MLPRHRTARAIGRRASLGLLPLLAIPAWAQGQAGFRPARLLTPGQAGSSLDLPRA